MRTRSLRGLFHLMLMAGAMALPAWALAQANELQCRQSFGGCFQTCGRAGYDTREALRDCQAVCRDQLSQCTGQGRAVPGNAGNPMAPNRSGSVAPNGGYLPPGLVQNPQGPLQMQRAPRAVPEDQAQGARGQMPSRAGAPIQDAAAPVDNTPPPDYSAITAPLSAQELDRLFAPIARSSPTSAMETLQQMQNLPSCRMNGGALQGPPGQCMADRQALRERSRADNVAQWADALRPAVRSMELEFPLLPQDPVGRIRALDGLKHKYNRLLAMAGQAKGQAPTGPGSDVVAASVALTEKLANLRSAAVQDPAVKQAYLENRLEGLNVELPLEQKVEWGADRETHHIAQQLRNQGRTLFMDRTVDLQRSAREANQGGQWASWGEPSENEMGLALLRTLSLVGGRQTRPYESERMSVPGLPIADMVLRVVDIQKLSCRKAEDGYRCKTRVWITYFTRGMAAGALQGNGNSMMMGMLGQMKQGVMERNGTEIEHVFRATQLGWIAPEQLEKLANSDKSLSNSLKNSQDNARAARCTSARMSGNLTQQSLNCN